ncbi:MAG: hypothetical protein K2J80_11875 [Oscillospiraceae bacterium]|nr:hypothetical protein [Oscillospiraceae bacterium]
MKKGVISFLIEAAIALPILTGCGTSEEPPKAEPRTPRRLPERHFLQAPTQTNRHQARPLPAANPSRYARR